MFNNKANYSATNHKEVDVQTVTTVRGKVNAWLNGNERIDPLSIKCTNVVKFYAIGARNHQARTFMHKTWPSVDLNLAWHAFRFSFVGFLIVTIKL